MATRKPEPSQDTAHRFRPGTRNVYRICAGQGRAAVTGTSPVIATQTYLTKCRVKLDAAQLLAFMELLCATQRQQGASVIPLDTCHGHMCLQQDRIWSY